MVAVRAAVARAAAVSAAVSAEYRIGGGGADGGAEPSATATMNTPASGLAAPRRDVITPWLFGPIRRLATGVPTNTPLLLSQKESPKSPFACRCLIRKRDRQKNKKTNLSLRKAWYTRHFQYARLL